MTNDEEYDDAATVDVPSFVRAPFVPGLFDDMDAATYHGIEALSSSGVRKLLQSPMHYKLFRERPNPPTPQMQFGTAVHLGVLEPDAFQSRVVRAPVVNKRTKDGKAELAAFHAAHGDCIVLSPYDFERAHSCVRAIAAHPAAQRLLTGATVERSLFWNDGRYKVPCKARFDAWNDGVLVDVKTTTDASAEEFARTIANFGYHTQAAMYCSAAEHVLDTSPDAFVFVVVESEPPHGVACYQLPNAAILAGFHLVNRALARYAEVMQTGKWSGYAETIEVIELPRYAMRFAA